MSFSGARVAGRTVHFSYAPFSGGVVSFRGARLCSGVVNFSDAKFSGGTVDFREVEEGSVLPWDDPPPGVCFPARG